MSQSSLNYGFNVTLGGPLCFILLYFMYIYVPHILFRSSLDWEQVSLVPDLFYSLATLLEVQDVA